MKKIEMVLIAILSIILVCSVSYIINYKCTLYKEEKQMNQLREKLRNPEKDITNQKEKSLQQNIETENGKDSKMQQNDETEDTKEILPKLKELYKENSDIVGWIKIKDTPIDYPVMKTSKKKQNFYLHKDWDKKDSDKGLPYVDSWCDIDGKNIVIYAHHMKDGSMFGSLKYYQDEKYFKEHNVIKFNTLYEKRKYKIIGVCLSKVYYDNKPHDGEFLYYNYLDISSKDEFEEYVSNVKANSLYDTGETATYDDNLLTLCTCMYHTENGRMIVVAKEVKK